MKKFTNTASEETIKFSVEDDEFEAIAPRNVPASILETYFKNIKAGDLFDAHNNFFGEVLTEESHKVFTDRLSSREKPITLETLGEISSWLLGDIYMGGGSGNGSTTAPEASSSNGPPAKKRGQNSTPGAV